MIRLLEQLLRRRRPERAVMPDPVLQAEFDGIRKMDPETPVQWLRLQRTLAQQTPEPRRIQSRLIPRFAFSVAIVAAAIIGSYFYFTPEASQPATFVTHRGQQTRLTLQDSSEVTLNYVSELVVQRLSPDKPRLLSLKGEAYFRVRHNPMPFIVSTGFAEVQVVGTAFNLRSREGMLEVAVTEGIVRVTATKDGKDSSVTLTHDEMAVVAKNDFPRKTGKLPSPEYPGWMGGKLFFNRATFEAACRELEMRFDVIIRIEDRNVLSEVVTGMLSAHNADSAVAALCGLAGKQFRRIGQEYLIH